MEAPGFEMRSEATLRTLTEDVVKTSEIEGEILAPDRVRSSIASRLGLDAGGVPVPDRAVDGVVEMTLDTIEELLAQCDETAPDDTEERAWLDASPAGDELL